MRGIEALVLLQRDLEQVAQQAGQTAAERVLEAFRHELTTTPTDKTTERLRRYIEDRTTCDSPREHWAHSRHIRMLSPTKSGKPK